MLENLRQFFAVHVLQDFVNMSCAMVGMKVTQTLLYLSLPIS